MAKGKITGLDHRNFGRILLLLEAMQILNAVRKWQEIVLQNFS